MEQALIIEINAFCIAFMLFFLFKLRGKNNSVVQRAFRRLLVTEALMFLSDLVYLLAEGKPGAMIYLNISANIVYFTMSALSPYLMLGLIRAELEKAEQDLSVRLMTALPAILVIVLACLSPFNGWLYEINGRNEYYRGIFYSIQPIVSLCYLAFGSITAFRTAFKTNSYSMRQRGLTLGVFTLFPILGAVGEVLTDLPTLCIFVTFAMVAMFTNLQEQKISRDSLTGMNNRYEIRKYIDTRTAINAGHVMMMFIDIDDFKHINDTFGHPMGDEALRRVAEVLRNICGKYSMFGSRYGGDEFVLIMEHPEKQNPEQIRTEIMAAVSCITLHDRCPLSVSVGIAECNLKEESFEELLARADKQMYENKH